IWRSLIESKAGLAQVLFRALFMRKLASVVVASLCFSFSASAQTGSAQATQNPQIITVSQIHAGMRGVAYTVFEGVKPEAMEVEVLGVLRNVNGPKGDII